VTLGVDGALAGPFTGGSSSAALESENNFQLFVSIELVF